MNNGKQIAGIVLVLGMVFLLSCAPQAAPAPAPQPGAPAPRTAPASAPAVPAAQARPAWEEEWQKTLNAARKEGKFVVLGSISSGTRSAIKTAMAEFGISAEVINGVVTALVPRIEAERKAGIYDSALTLSGPATSINTLKPKGMLQPLEPALILPEVKDPNAYYQGKFPWVDADHTTLTTAYNPLVGIAINPNLVKPDEIKSWRDLLDPKWKGKIVTDDPTRPGTGQAAMAGIYGVMGEDYLRELVKAEPVILSDPRLAIEWVAHGKIPIVLAPHSEMFVEFVRIGVPLKAILPKEGTFVAAASGGLSWFSQATHPNAVKVFINWLMSKEGQAVYAPVTGYHSARLDAPTAHLQPEQMRQPGVKYFDRDSEEIILMRSAKLNKLVEGLFAPLKQ